MKRVLLKSISHPDRQDRLPIRITGLLLLALCFLLLSAFAAETPKRIISLAPSLTEILFALGLGDNIAGVTSFCDFPEEAKKKPKIGGMSNPSLDAVVSLKPDVVVFTTDGNPKEFEERLRNMKIKTYVFRARRLNELPDGIRGLGAALGVKERADSLAKEIEDNIGKFKTLASVRTQADSSGKTSGPGRQRAAHKKVLFVVWPEPLIVAGPGTVINDAITLLGGENIASGAKTNWPKYSIEEILRRSPDLIFFGKGMMNVEEVSEGLLMRLKILPAVKNKKIFYVSDDLYRLGPRTVRGIEEISMLMEK